MLRTRTGLRQGSGCIPERILFEQAVGPNPSRRRNHLEARDQTGQLTLSTSTSSVSLSGQIEQSGTLSGTFQFNGQTPYCQPNDSGTFAGTSVALLAGQWSGTATSAVTGHSFPVSLSFTENSLAPSGFPALKGQAMISSGSLGCVTGTATFDGEQQGSRISGQGGGASGPLPALDNTVVIGGALISNTLSTQNIEVTAGLGTFLNPAPTNNSMTMFYSASCPIPPLTQDSGTVVINRQP